MPSVKKRNQFGKILGFFPTRELRRWGIGSELFSSVLCRIRRSGKPPPHPSPLRRALISYWGHWEAYPECICIDLHISHQALLVAFLRKTRIGGMMISLAGNGHIYYPSHYLSLFFIFFPMPTRQPPPVFLSLCFLPSHYLLPWLSIHLLSFCVSLLWQLKTLLS